MPMPSVQRPATPNKLAATVSDVVAGWPGNRSRRIVVPAAQTLPGAPAGAVATAPSSSTSLTRPALFQRQRSRRRTRPMTAPPHRPQRPTRRRRGPPSRLRSPHRSVASLGTLDRSATTRCTSWPRYCAPRASSSSRTCPACAPAKRSTSNAVASRRTPPPTLADLRRRFEGASR